MKVLLLNEMMNSGTVSFFIREQTAIELCRKGHKVTMISPSLSSPSWGKYYSKNGIKYVFTPSILPAKFRRGGFGVLDLLVKFLLVLFTKYNIVHSTSGHRPSQFLPSMLAKHLKKTIVIDEWWEWYGKEGRFGTRDSLLGRIIGSYDEYTEIRFRKFYDHVLPISSYLRDRIINSGYDKDNVTILHGSLGTSNFNNIDLNIARNKIKVNENLFLIGLISVGQADHNDNKSFIEAFKYLSKLHPELRLFITGEKEYILNQFEHEIGKTVLYPGWLNFDQYNIYLSSCNLFVLPLENIPRNLGRWPHKFSEFVFLDRPIISSKQGDQSYFIKKYNLGQTIENNFKQFVEIIEGYLQKPRKIMHFDKEVKDLFSLESRVSKLEKVYMKLL